jgi:PAS domain S-box-containing protein
MKPTYEELEKQVQTLRDESARRRALMDYSRDGIVVLDQTGQVVESNRRFADMLGYPLEEMTRLKVFDWEFHNRPELIIEMLTRVDEKGDHFETRHRRKDGSVYDVEICTNAVWFDEQKLIFCVCRDITDRKQQEAEREKLQTRLYEARKMESVGRLAGGIAHDFNNMLGVILGNTELALLRTNEDDYLFSNLNEIQTAAKRSADLVRQLLAFARKQPVFPRNLDLNDAVDGLLNVIRRLIGEDIDLVWKPGVRLWPVKIDPTQIHQILANLCMNARDAISGRGRIIIETGKKTFKENDCLTHPGFKSGDYVCLVVEDNGCGMDKNTLTHLFEPFFTTKEVGKGTGLGLATVYGIVRQNSGFIDVDSVPGQGAEFRIYLPRAQETTDNHKEKQV